MALSWETTGDTTPAQESQRDRTATTVGPKVEHCVKKDYSQAFWSKKFAYYGAPGWLSR